MVGDISPYITTVAIYIYSNSIALYIYTVAIYIYIVYINPQELILRPIAASEKSKVMAGIYKCKKKVETIKKTEFSAILSM